MIMCVLLCYPVSIHMSQLLSTGRPISSLYMQKCCKSVAIFIETLWYKREKNVVRACVKYST